MRRLVIAASLTLAVSVPAILSVSNTTVAVSVAQAHSIQHRAYCHHRLFTVQEGERAARAVFRDIRRVSRRNLRMLGQIERCQRNPQARDFVRWYDHHQAQLHDQRVAEHNWDLAHPWQSAQVSWFDDGQSPPACGDLAPDGVASRDYPCGTKVDFRWGGRQVTAVVDDYGPADWTGRMWDLDQTTASDLGFIGTDVGAMDYRVR